MIGVAANDRKIIFFRVFHSLERKHGIHYAETGYAGKRVISVVTDRRVGIFILRSAFRHHFKFMFRFIRVQFRRDFFRRVRIFARAHGIDVAVHIHVVADRAVHGVPG